MKIAESGAIVEYLIAQHGKGRLGPTQGSPDWLPYIEWLHYTEGSATLPLLLHLYTMRLGEAGAAPSAHRERDPESPRGHCRSLGRTIFFPRGADLR